MIIVKLIGGLGNQMFQYATGRNLAILKNTELLIDTSFLDKNPDGAYTKRNLELNVFNLDLKIASQNDIEKFKINTSNKYTRTLQRNFPFLFKNLYVAESGVGYHKQFLNFRKNTYLDGFWQSEKYFDRIKSILFKEFIPKEPLNTENIDWLDKIKASESISLHVRRGDYITQNSALDFHGLCDITYYESAINIIKENNSVYEIFVFSDDLEWCKANFNFLEKTHFVDSNQNTNAYLDLFLMSNCKHNVIANSSFSWWAAFLNQNNDRIVVAPKKWYTNTEIEPTDLFPSQWKII